MPFSILEEWQGRGGAERRQGNKEIRYLSPSFFLSLVPGAGEMGRENMCVHVHAR